MQLHPRQNRVELRAADVLKVDVDTAGCQPIERGADVFAAVVDAGIEAELVYHVLALVGTTGDADYPATFDFGDLSNQISYQPLGTIAFVFAPVAPAAPLTRTVSPSLSAPTFKSPK